MSKSIDKLTLSELIELKNASDLISEEYAKELTNYAAMNNDAYFKNISEIDKIKYEKRLKSKDLSTKIQKRIEKIVEEYYD